MPTPERDDAWSPRGPRPLPLAGNAVAFMRDKLGFLSQCADVYGDVVRLNLGLPTYLIRDPADIRHVLISNSANYSKTPRISKRNRSFFGEGVVSVEGPDHLRQRRALLPLFHTDVISQFGASIAASAEVMMLRWTMLDQVDVHAEMLDLTQDVTARLLFGDNQPDDDRSAFKAAVSIRRAYQEHILGDLLALALKPPAGIKRQHERADHALDAMIADAILQRRKAVQAPTDLIGLLCQTRYDDGSSMSDQQIRDEIRTISVGGYETLAEALGWTWYLLAQSPHAEKMVYAEACSISPTRETGVRDLEHLSFARKVLSESLRMYPPAWLFVRVAADDDQLPSGASIPGGSKIYVSPWVSHHNPRYFPDPYTFDPERFDEEAVKSRPRFTYIPFGGGRRLCVGENLAWMEGILIIASIARRFRLRLPEGHLVEIEPNVTLRPKNGLPMMVAAR